MKLLNPADYDEKQLEDFSKYVFGMFDHETLKDVMKQQKGREEQCRKQGCWWKREETTGEETTSYWFDLPDKIAPSLKKS